MDRTIDRDRLAMGFAVACRLHVRSKERRARSEQVIDKFLANDPQEPVVCIAAEGAGGECPLSGSPIL